eukprot:GEMP01057313.1.p2 GENE.GEMP01057313.1~~GEMP01057313.1.p2  ORF type:complete len:127 (+),score=27.44 GEMP01057313.1:56-436(+)
MLFVQMMVLAVVGSSDNYHHNNLVNVNHDQDKDRNRSINDRNSNQVKEEEEEEEVQEEEEEEVLKDVSFLEGNRRRFLQAYCDSDWWPGWCRFWHMVGRYTNRSISLGYRRVLGDDNLGLPTKMLI